MNAAAIIVEGAPVAMRPWPRYALDASAWAALADALVRDPLPLDALWADTEQVYALFVAADRPLLASVPAAGGYAALSPARPAIAAAERAVHDLFGHRALGVELTPWLDHGHWEHARPYAARPVASPGNTDAPEFSGPPGIGQVATGQVAIGPVRGKLAPPMHIRLFTQGPRVISAQTRQGYAHRGTMLLARGKTPRLAGRFAARLDGTATVAHGVAFARAAEAASGIAAPPRAKAVREALLLLERLALRLHDLTAMLDAAGAARLGGRCAMAREALLVALGVACGHRLAMDVVVPGGIAVPLSDPQLAVLAAATQKLERALPALARIPDRLEDRADAAAARLAGMRADAATLRGLLHAVPPGETSLVLPPESGEGLARAEGPVGAVWHWMRLDRGQIAAWFASSPGAGALEAALVGQPVEALDPIEAAGGYRVAGRDG